VRGISRLSDGYLGRLKSQGNPVYAGVNGVGVHRVTWRGDGGRGGGKTAGGHGGDQVQQRMAAAPHILEDRSQDSLCRSELRRGRDARYCTKALSISEAELREAVIAVGTSADAVGRYLLVPAVRSFVSMRSRVQRVVRPLFSAGLVFHVVLRTPRHKCFDDR
jgi:hypothetical protein